MFSFSVKTITSCLGINLLSNQPAVVPKIDNTSIRNTSYSISAFKSMSGASTWQFYEGYGQTECTAGCTMSVPGDWTAGNTHIQALPTHSITTTSHNAYHHMLNPTSKSHMALHPLYTLIIQQQFYFCLVAHWNLHETLWDHVGIMKEQTKCYWNVTASLSAQVMWGLHCPATM